VLSPDAQIARVTGTAIIATTTAIAPALIHRRIRGKAVTGPSFSPSPDRPCGMRTRANAMIEASATGAARRARYCVRFEGADEADRSKAAGESETARLPKAATNKSPIPSRETRTIRRPDEASPEGNPTWTDRQFVAGLLELRDMSVATETARRDQRREALCLMTTAAPMLVQRTSRWILMRGRLSLTQREPLEWALEDLSLRPLPCQGGQKRQASDQHPRLSCHSGTVVYRLVRSAP
jgi:hypothetical protein